MAKARNKKYGGLELKTLRFIVGLIVLSELLSSSPSISAQSVSQASRESTNNVTRPQVIVTGKPLSSPSIPPTAITLKPGQPIPVHARIGQVFVSPKIVPPNFHGLIVHANPGQSVSIKNYSGPVIIMPTYPTITKIIPAQQSLMKSTAFFSNLSYSNSTAAKTAVLFAEYINGASSYGGILDFNGTWVTDNHVLNDIDVNPMSPPRFIQIAHSATGDVAESYNVEDIYSYTLGLASPYNVGAPTGSAYVMTVVNSPSLGQSVFDYSQIQRSSFGNYIQNASIIRLRVGPGANVYPDPMTNIYDRFSPIGIVTNGWSGTGVWDAQNHLIAMTEGGSSSKNMFWGFNGGDIRNFCNEVGIAYNTSYGS